MAEHVGVLVPAKGDLEYLLERSCEVSDFIAEVVNGLVDGEDAFLVVEVVGAIQLVSEAERTEQGRVGALDVRAHVRGDFFLVAIAGDGAGHYLRGLEHEEQAVIKVRINYK